MAGTDIYSNYETDDNNQNCLECNAECCVRWSRVRSNYVYYNNRYPPRRIKHKFMDR